jgi:hypothetical protein
LPTLTPRMDQFHWYLSANDTAGGFEGENDKVQKHAVTGTDGIDRLALHKTISCLNRSELFISLSLIALRL